jgi:hypothetical protein
MTILIRTKSRQSTIISGRAFERRSMARSGAAGRWIVFVLLSCVFATLSARADEGPDAAMMAPVTALASFMAHVDGATRPPVFVEDGLVIIENFPPYIFRGKDVVTRWDEGYRHHVADCKLADLKVTFGKAHDFNSSGNRAYFVLPTHWQGKCPLGSGPFEESGAWAFVLAKSSGQWRITGYAWGVYQSTYEAD